MPEKRELNKMLNRSIPYWKQPMSFIDVITYQDLAPSRFTLLIVQFSSIRMDQISTKCRVTANAKDILSADIGNSWPKLHLHCYSVTRTMARNNAEASNRGIRLRREINSQNES